LVEDEDLSYDMKREEFEELIKPDLERVKKSLLKLKDEIALKNLDIHSVEIVGGTTRIPSIQAIITEVFGMEISKTLN